VGTGSSGAGVKGGWSGWSAHTNTASKPTVTTTIITAPRDGPEAEAGPQGSVELDGVEDIRVHAFQDSATAHYSHREA
jgi:hypothetical protein